MAPLLSLKDQQYFKKKQEEDLIKQKEIKDQENRNKIYRYKYIEAHNFHGLGKFYLCTFSEIEHNTKLLQNNWKLTSSFTIFCYTLEENKKLFLNNWSKAKKHEFKVTHKIDLQKLQHWFEIEKKKPNVLISTFFIK